MPHFLLVDCNNFYVSCERLFNPRLEGRPVLVLSNNDGCVVARSDEVKKLGIKMGDPFFKIQAFCSHHSVVIYSSNYGLYGNISQRVMNTLKELAPQMEIYSIDEAFLTYPSHLPTETMMNEAAHLRNTVKKWVGIPTCVGIGPTKTLAKAANALAKKNRDKGIFHLNTVETQKEALSKMAVEDIWGIGSALKGRLNALGIYSAWDFREADPGLIRRKLGVVGERMMWELRGVSCLPLQSIEPKKNIGCSRSFGTVVTEIHQLAEALASHVSSACRKLRKQKSCAHAIHVYLESAWDAQLGGRPAVSATVPFAVATDDIPFMIGAAKKALSVLFREGERYKKCGILLLDIIPEKNVALDLFTSSTNAKRKAVMATMDSINHSFGKGTIFYAAQGTQREWSMRAEKRSQDYVTQWDSLPIVKGK